MADPGLTGPDQDAAARRVVGAYLGELAGQLGGRAARRCLAARAALA